MLNAGNFIQLMNRQETVHQLNEVYREALSKSGEAHFVKKVLETLNINCELSPSDLARIPSNGPVVVVANHPFGAIEGMILLSTLRSVRPDVTFNNLKTFDTDADLTAYLRQRTYILSHREDARFNNESNCISSALDGRRESKTGSILPARMRRRSVTGRVKLEPIAPPQEPSMLTDEVRSLPPEQILVRSGESIIFRADFDQIPCLMQEIGCLREISFRNVGEGIAKRA